MQSSGDLLRPCCSSIREYAICLDMQVEMSGKNCLLLITHDAIDCESRKKKKEKAFTTVNVIT